MRKRQKFVLTTLILTLGFAVFGQIPFEFKYLATGVLSALTFVLFAWSLRDGLAGVEWLTLLLPPVLFTAGFTLFSILVPDDWIRIVPRGVAVVAGNVIMSLIFGLGQYTMLLTANIFSVAAIRTIALFWAASAMGFVIAVISGFFWYDTILSFRLPFWTVGILVSGISFLILLPGIWSVLLEDKLSLRVVGYAGILAILIGLLAMAVSFWPVGIAVESLFLATALYIFWGITQHHFSEKLQNRTLWEYLTVGIVVLVTMLITSIYAA